MNAKEYVLTLDGGLDQIVERAFKADKKCGACERGSHEDCSGWCFCPLGPCDR